MIRQKGLLLFLSINIFLLVSLACNLGGPTPDATAYPTLEPTQLASSMETSIAGTPETRTAVITLNEQQVSSYLAQKIAEQPDAPFSNTQVLLRSGQMEIYGTAATAGVTANVKIVTQVTMDEQGLPTVNILSADFGPIPAPGTLKDFLARLLNNSIVDGFGSTQGQFKIIGIEIGDGLLVITLQQAS